MNHQEIIERTVAYVKQELQGAEAGHDWFHIERVWRNSKAIAETEASHNMLVVELGALLHDIADSKFHGGDEEIGPKKAEAFMRGLYIDNDLVQHVVNIIRNISFKGGYKSSNFSSIELHIVQDADRLDALGAIGIARTFHYGGFKNRILYDPEVPPNMNMSKEEYKKSVAPTLNHFYEKLLLLKNLMNTRAGKEMAIERHRFMEAYLEQFYREWGG